MDIATFINYDVKNRRNTLRDLSSINSHVALSQGAPREEMSQEQDETPLFFVAENPPSRADTARNRAVIRSQITKSYWRQTRRGRGGVNEPAHRHLRIASSSGPERPRRRSAGGWNEVDTDDRSSEQQKYSNSRSWEYSIQQQENSRLHASQQNSTHARTFGGNDSSHSNNPFEATDEFPLPPNPNSLLGSGSQDPFRSYPSQLEPSSVAKLTHHSMEELWPGLLASDPGGLDNPLVTHWFVPSITNPSLFNALMFGAAIHFQTRKLLQQRSKVVEETPRIQFLQSQAIQHLNKAVQDPFMACTDQIICAVMILTCSGADLSRPRVSRTLFNPPLTSLQWLDVYATIDMVEMHFQGLERLVKMRGRLANLEMYGVADIIILGDMIDASKRLSKPRFPWYSSYRANERKNSHSSILDGFSMLGDTLGLNFWNSQHNIIPNELLNAVLEMVKYVAMVESYCRGTTAKPNMNSMTHHRNFAHHQVLSLSSATELGHTFSQNYPAYESCRLAALIFSLGVTFPMPSWAAPFPHLAQALQQALIEVETSDMVLAGSDILLWILVLGGIAASEQASVRTWFVTALRNFSIHRGLNGWEQAKTILTEILWLASACDVAGRSLWDEFAHAE